jgi:hypothetical protein
VALFEGNDEHGRLQPLLGTAEPATDFQGNSIDWPDTLPGGTCETGCDVGLCVTNDCDDTANCEGFDCSGCPYKCANLTGPIEGTAAWHTKTTENPALGSCEEWEIWNVSADAHPVHLHLVHFEVVSRHEIIYDTGIPGSANGDGIYVTEQRIVQHNGKLGTGKKIVYPSVCLSPNSSPSSCYNSTALAQEPRYVETGPLDVVTALPNQVTKIRVLFDKPGRYVWHCHLLSHEDHEMMRVLQVGPE